MRVLHVQKVKGIGGSERHLLSLLPGLAACGDQVRMLVLAAGEEEGRFLAAGREAAIDFVVERIGADADPRPAMAIAREIHRYRAQVVHTHLVHADLWGQLAARRLAIPGVRTAHDAQAFYRREPARAAGRLAGGLARRTIAISRHVAAFVERGGLAPPDRIRVIHYGIDVRAWGATEEERVLARSALGVGPGDVAVGMAARLIPGKGHGLALAAFERALTTRPGLRLLIAGDGPLRVELEASARRLPDRSVRFAGQVDDVRPFLAACDVLLFPTLPSLSEGFGLAALEAMAAGRPVVATDVGGLPEVVSDGETGLVVRPAPGHLAAALERLADDPGLRGELGRRGRERAERAFGVDRMVQRTRAIYRELIR